MNLTQSKHKIKYKDSIRIVPIGDIHEGQIGAAIEELKTAIKSASETPNTFIVLMGDLIDAIVPLGDKRFNPNEIDKKYTIEDLEDLPRLQADRIVELFEPVKSKILTYVSGNHENAFTKYHGFNPAKYIARRLDVPLVNYFGYHTMIVDVGGHCETLKIYLNHGGGGGGKTAGYAKSKIDDLTRHFDFDMALLGHTHRIEVLHNTRVGINNNGTALKRKRNVVVNTGCFLRTYGEHDNYFAANGCRESDIGHVNIDITFKNCKTDGWIKKYKVEEVRL